MFTFLACGSNGNYQLGLGNDDDHDTLQDVSSLTSVGSAPQKFAFGGNHTLVLFPNGKVYAAGNNEYGQCGLPPSGPLKEFTLLPGEWKDVAAGWEFSVLCRLDGQVYSCGYGPKGELGLGPDVTKATMQKVDLCTDLPIVEIKSSVSHTVARLSDGTLVGWGASRKGQLGDFPPQKGPSGKEKPLASLWVPTILPLPHSTGYTLGRDRTVLSTGDDINIYGVNSTTVNASATKVMAMWSSVHYGTNSNGKLHIKSVGNNLHGQLYQHTNVEPVDFEVGSEHGIVLLKDNSVHAWGWGEHGNCGRSADGSVTFSQLNKIYSGEHTVVHMACGQATTWLVVRM